MASVELAAVSKSFSNSEPAVNQIDLQIEDREFLVLVGPSGCGKSTTLRLIAGLESCDSGEIRIDGRKVNSVSPKDRNIAMVFQNYALYPHMSVYKNLSFGLQLRLGGGIVNRVVSRLIQPRRASAMAEQRREIHDRVMATAERLGIEKLLNRKPHQLSGGERQRVALGRAIVRNPAAFLFDEPLSNLDAKLRTQLRREIKQLHTQLQTTMIYVTHDQVEAMTLGDRIAVMNKGELQQIGRPLDVYQKPANLFVARFIGSLPMNLVNGKFIKEKNDLAFQFENGSDYRTKLDLSELNDKFLNTQDFGAQSRVTLGIRPENVEFIGNRKIDTGREASNHGNEVTKKGGNHNLLPTIVTAVDHLGDSTVVHMKMANDQLTEQSHRTNQIDKPEPKNSVTEERGKSISISARITGTSWTSVSPPRPGDPAGVRFDLQSAHWFDSVSGTNIESKN